MREEVIIEEVIRGGGEKGTMIVIVPGIIIGGIPGNIGGIPGIIGGMPGIIGKGGKGIDGTSAMYNMQLISVRRKNSCIVLYAN